MSKLGFFSDPHVQYVSQVIEEVLAGNLQIPRFQRPYVWEWDRRLDLLRSIQLGIPMGAIMIWRTSIEALTTFDSFGTVRFKQPQTTGPRQYLLDGVQRLSTLVSALTPPGDFIDEVDPNTKYFVEEADRAAFFDLESNDFVSIKVNQAGHKHMPLHVLSNSVALLRFQRNLTGPHLDRWIANSDAVARAFREYKVPVIPIVTDDIGLASQTFQRINSAGQQMSEKHMLHALTFSTSFDFTTALDQFRESLDDIGWNEIDDDLMLRLLKVSMQLDMYKANVDDVSAAIRNRPNLFSELNQAVRDAAGFFLEYLNMPSPEFVPYSVQVVGVVEAFRVANKDLASMPKDALKDWIWLTTYLEYFTGLSGDKVTRQINFIRSSVGSGKIILTQSGLPMLSAVAEKNRFDYRGARSRSLMNLLVYLANEKGYDFGTNLVRMYGRSAIMPGIPRDKFRNKNLYSSPGNRFLVAPTNIDNFRNTLLNLPDRKFLKNHGIGDQYEFILKGEFDEFVSARSGHLFDMEMERVDYLWETTSINKVVQENIKRRFADAISDSNSLVREILESALSDHFKNADWNVGDVYSSGGDRVEGEIYDVKLDGYDIDVDPLGINESEDEPGSWIANLAAKADLTVSVELRFFKWDSSDHEEFELPGYSVTIGLSKEVEISLSSFGITEENEIEDWGVEVDAATSSYEVDVGEVEPHLDDGYEE